MNQMIVALIILLNSHSGQAVLPKNFGEQPLNPRKSTSTLMLSDIIGQQGIDLFQRILSEGNLYTLLLALNQKTPEIAQQAKYIALLNEIHLANQTLSSLLVELKNNNRMLKQTITGEGTSDG